MAVKEVHGHWSSRFSFILAAVGAAVGLGNFWRFPYTAGENGGGAFVLIYMLCVIIVALPILMGELLIGRRGGLSAVGSTYKVPKEEGLSGAWSSIGWIGMIASFLILTFYSVIAGWIIAYIPESAVGGFTNITAVDSGAKFNDLLSQPGLLMFYHGLFMALTIFIVARGLNQGIEVAVQVLMPIFFFMLVGVVIFSVSIGDTQAAFDFLFYPDFSKVLTAGFPWIKLEVFLEAIGQAFFSIGVGAAIMLTYGAYLTSATRIPFASSVISFADTFVAILAGIAIFPIVFAFGLNPAEGPGLIFVTLPVAFGQMPYGQLIGTAFFVLALFAAVTSSISLLEIFVSWGEEHRGWGRKQTAVAGGAVAWLIGLGSVFSLNDWSDFHPLGMFPAFEGKTIFDLLDFVTANIMLPLSGLLLAILVGWRLSRSLSLSELGVSDGRFFAIWYFLLRWIAPIAVGAVLINLAILQVFFS